MAMKLTKAQEGQLNRIFLSGEFGKGSFSTIQELINKGALDAKGKITQAGKDYCRQRGTDMPLAPSRYSNPATRGGGAVPRCTCGGKVERFGKMTHCGHARTCPVYAKSLADGLETGHSGKRSNPAKPAKTGRAGNPHYTLSYNATLYLSPTLKGATTRVSGSDNWPVEVLESSGPKKARRALIKVDVGGKYAYGWVDYDQLIGRRGNPDTDSTAASDMYETFHGKPSTGSVDYSEDYYEPDAYAELGDLIELWLIPIHSSSDKAQKIESANPDTANSSDVVKLACSPDGTQLYFIGGDQGIDLSALGFESSETRQHMMLGVLCELTYRAKKGFHKFKLTDYFHRLGEESGNEPFLCYDPHSQKLTVVGGSYKVKDVGIVD